MILGRGEPKWMWHLRISWWHRQKFRLWVYFLPHRIVCFVRRSHIWDQPYPAIDLGPLHLPPDQRFYRVLSYDQRCTFCLARRPVPLTPEKELELIQEAQAEDWEEWNDPETRALLRRLR